jgi:hypothetical protein
MQLPHHIYRTAHLVMKGSLHITATVDQPDLLKDLVEKLACKRNDTNLSYSRERRLIETSSTEAYVSGTVELDFGIDMNNEKINVPFITCFLFTCKKAGMLGYELAFSQSLS